MTRDEAIKYLIRPVSTSTVPSKEIEKQFEAYEMAIEAIRKESNVHAHWIHHRLLTDVWICSECKEENYVPKEYWGDTLPDYCPNCGAIMDEEAET